MHAWRLLVALLIGPSIVQPSPIDLTPNPVKLASGALPLELPFGPNQIGNGYIERQRHLMQRIHPETDHDRGDLHGRLRSFRALWLHAPAAGISGLE